MLEIVPFAAALSALAPAHAAPPPALSADSALLDLLDAEEFEDLTIGIDGHTSRSVQAFRIVFAAPDAARRLRMLATHGTLVGKLYAAIGLRHHDAAAYSQTLEELARSREERVPARIGCAGLHLRVGELIESTEAGAVRLRPGDTLDAWLKARGGGDLDIVGGGYTAWFSGAAAR
jgi:hypothetical protein